MNDFKIAFRQLRKSPGFTLVAVLTLALGIGANTAIFSVVEGVLLRPLPFPNAERLVRIYEALDENGARSGTLNLSDRTVARFREFGRDIFEDVAGGTGSASVVSAKAGSPTQTVPAALVTYNFFDVLGLPPSQGRNFTTEEGSDKAANVVIISDDFRVFIHAHPQLEPSGHFLSAQTLPQPGLYHLFADGDISVAERLR